MATTNSADKKLNCFQSTSDENSGVEDAYIINTGNEKTKLGEHVLNDTYTLQSNGGVAEVNAKLIGYNDIVSVSGSDIIDSVEGQTISDANLINRDQSYTIIGQPNKWVYDYQQEYSNCGVDSCLNVLSMAGKKDIVEITKEYAEYLATPQKKKEKYVYFDNDTNEWKTGYRDVAVMPKAPNETEDELLLWAVKHSKNDELWYQKGYTPEDNPYSYYNDPDSYCLHKDNYTEYDSVKDLKEYPTQVGGTFYWQQENILRAMGVKADAGLYKFNQMIKEDAPIVEQGESTIKYEKTDKKNEDGKDIYKRTTTTIVKETNETHTTTTTTTTVTVEEVLHEEGQQDTLVGDSFLDKKTVVESKNVLNEYLYTFAQQFEKWIGEGRGIIVGGQANGFSGGSGGQHAITIVGVVRGDVTKSTQDVTHEWFDDNGEKHENQTTLEIEGHEYKDQELSANDIIGFYVIDTGGFLGNIEGAQFISIQRLYDFLTGTNYAKSEGDATDQVGSLVVTESNIKSWADNLNLIGNNAKNVLYGNYAKNTIKGGNGNDVLYGEAGDDKLYGDSDNDTLIGGLGDDTLYGGSGNDMYIFNAKETLTVNPEPEDLKYTTQEYGEGDDKTSIKTFTMDTTPETEDGQDYVYGQYSAEVEDKSNDVIIPGSGKDSLQFNDILKEDEDPLKTFHYMNKNGSLVISTGKGTVTIQDYFKKGLYSSIESIIKATTDGESGKVSVNKEWAFVKEILEKAVIEYENYVDKNNTNKISGTKFRDSMVGGNHNDTLSGGSGNDTLSGGNGNDVLKGGSGDDVIISSFGNDKIYGESGNNIIRYDEKALSGSDTIYSGSGKDIIELKSVEKSAVELVRSGDSLVIYYNKTTGDSITIADYFKKKGKVSVDYVEFKNGEKWYLKNSLSKVNEEVSKNPSKKIKGSGTITGGEGYDTLTGSSGNDTITGGLGNDTIKAGKGDDVLIGGLGNDKLYGESGNNTYKYENTEFGQDTIYVTGSGSTTLDFSNTDLSFDEKGIVDGANKYSYTKSGNDLIINFTKKGDNVDPDNSMITIKDFFKSKNSFTLKSKSRADLNLKDATIYFEGKEDKNNKITGSSINDSIVGGQLNDSIKGGAGNDTINGGIGNDTINGGSGDNVFEYKKGDGNDVIVLSKGENLDLKLTGFTKKEELSYQISGKNLLISYTNEDGTTSTITIKDFGKSDVTTSSGSVELYVGDQKAYDLRNDKFLATYKDFTAKEYSYTGSWFSEEIDARALNATDVVIKKSKGASINAGSGNDTIYGSHYNDTIKGGNGDDVIHGGFGKNSLDGGNGSDTYCLFESTTRPEYSVETSTVKDTGKTGSDTAEFNKSKDKIQVWFNVSKSGKVSGAVNVEDLDSDDSATLTGIEKFVANGGTSDKNDDYIYNFDAVKQQVATWLATHGYKDVNDVMKHAGGEARDEMLKLFNGESAWTKQNG